MQPPPSTVDLWILDPIPADVFAAWGQWAGGIGSVAAVFVALWVVRRESVRARRAEEAKSASRASALFAFPFEESNPDLLLKPGLVVDPSRLYRRGIRIENHSSSPFVNLHVIHFRTVTKGPNGAFDLGVVTPKELRVRILGAGQNAFVECQEIEDVWSDLVAKKVAIEVRIDYGDPDGREWCRYGQRLPREIRYSEAFVKNN